MKSIPNKTFDSEPKPVTVAELLATCLKSTPVQGFDLAALRARTRVLDSLEKIENGGMIELEDADYQTAQTAIKETKWAKLDKYIIAFAELFGV